MIPVIDEIADMFVKSCSKELIHFKITLVQQSPKNSHFHALKYFKKS